MARGPAPSPRRSSALFAVLAAAALWGISGVVARSLFKRAIDPVHLVQIRMLLGGLALVPLAILRRTAKVPRGEGPSLAAYALALAAVQVTYFKAIQAAGVAVAVFLQYTAPLVVAGWESARARRLPPRPILLALALATGGSALLVFPSGESRTPAAGIAWGLSSSIAMAAGTLLAAGARRRGFAAAPLLAYGLLLGSLVFLPLRSPWAALAAVPATDWPFFLYIAVLATAVPFALYAFSLATLPGTVSILLAMLEPVTAALLAWIALGEALAPTQLAGGALILGAVALAAVGSPEPGLATEKARRASARL